MGGSSGSDPIVIANIHEPCRTPKTNVLFLSVVVLAINGRSAVLLMATPRPPARPIPPRMLAKISQLEFSVSPNIAYEKNGRKPPTATNTLRPYLSARIPKGMYAIVFATAPSA